ncbi:MAG: preprotein translocase subunit YajC [Clostridia bacterium]|nr:preprotein translocase subunit YajC [Clostridia bacterium]
MSYVMTFGLPIIMLVGLYFLMVRPQRKEQKKRQAERGSMVVGDKVVTIGGIVGRVVNIKDNEITVSTSVANTMMTFRKEAIDQVIKPVSDDK